MLEEMISTKTLEVNDTFLVRDMDQNHVFEVKEKLLTNDGATIVSSMGEVPNGA